MVFRFSLDLFHVHKFEGEMTVILALLASSSSLVGPTNLSTAFVVHRFGPLGLSSTHCKL